MSGPAFVTGASGFLGRPLVAALLARGRPVVALCRRPESLADLRHPGLRIAAGDLRVTASWKPLLAGVESVFHLAGVRNQPRASVRDMEAVNVEATLALARAAGEAGVSRFVHVATALIYGPSRQGEARAERDGLDPDPELYVRSKIAAVQGLRALAAAGLPAVVVSPSIVFGPDHPSHPNRITAEIRRLLKGGPRVWVGNGRQARDLVFVDDVVDGLLAAEARGGVGEEYLLGGEEVSPRELAGQVQALAAARGVATSRLAFPLPAGVALAAAGIVDRLRGREAGAGYATSIRNLLREWRFSSAKAGRELGYRPRPLAAGLARTIDGLLPRGG
ncbi:MAG TPA: NAD-dependent epimerase/dehydratase family protein [Thermoanaerobaculia bacterium]|nr:NAD-dependent epimerase/dehydratase family protein [Thermoanaerobaculia bacterium]